MKKRIISFIVLVTTIILIALVLVYSKGNKINVKISGVNIDEDEYIRSMNNKRYEVTEYFIDKYGAKITNDFWGKEFDGEYPYKMLADKTMEELLNIHSIYEIAKDKGYVDSVEYKDFITRFNNENKRREESKKKGETIYGLSKYTEDLYLEYETDQIQKAYCNDVKNEGMEISLEDSKKYYEANKDKMFVKNDDFEISFVKVYYEALSLSKEEVEEIKKQMIEVSKKIDENNSLSDLIANNKILKDYYTHEVIPSEQLSAKAKTMGDVLDIAMDLQKGDTTQVLDENGCLYLMQCINRVNYDYIPFEEVIDNINKVLREERYDDIITKGAEKLEVSGSIDSIYNFTKANVK